MVEIAKKFFRCRAYVGTVASGDRGFNAIGRVKKVRKKRTKKSKKK